MIIACVGSRSLPSCDCRRSAEMGRWLAEAGHIVSSGNAVGADQAFLRGAIRGGGQVHVYLPYICYPTANAQVFDPRYAHQVTQWLAGDPQWRELAARYRPGFQHASEAAKLMLARNAAMVYWADRVLAWPHGKASGTQHSIRCAQGLGKPLVDLSQIKLPTTSPALLRLLGV